MEYSIHCAIRLQCLPSFFSCGHLLSLMTHNSLGNKSCCFQISINEPFTNFLVFSLFKIVFLKNKYKCVDETRLANESIGAVFVYSSVKGKTQILNNEFKQKRPANISTHNSSATTQLIFIHNSYCIASWPTIWMTFL